MIANIHWTGAALPPHPNVTILGTFRSLRFTVGWPLKSCTHTGIYPSVGGPSAVKRKPRKVPITGWRGCQRSIQSHSRSSHLQTGVYIQPWSIYRPPWRWNHWITLILWRSSCEGPFCYQQRSVQFYWPADYLESHRHHPTIFHFLAVLILPANTLSWMNPQWEDMLQVTNQSIHVSY